MQRKNVDLSQIYDAIAVRILVQTVQDCYATLSIVQEYFQSIPEEFDDYIATPKSNGYQSIHLALLNENHKTFEVQIRTHQMHKLSEQGVAAHWMYKEGKQEKSSYEQKIAWLRNLLEWQKELTRDRSLPAQLEKDLFEDRVYVFTPLGDIIDLINGATPLDFAYCIHTDLGHRCHGAKVNRKIVPLTYQLKTGDQVEILTSNRNKPSRDWLLLQRGYLKTSTARVKVLQWFKQQDYSRHITEGKALLERELQRLNIINVNFGDIAIKLQFKSTEMMFAALGRGDLRLSQVLSVIHSKFEPHLFKSREEEIVVKKVLKQLKDKGNVTIFGVEHLLSHIARCCKPIPGDPIVGYITQTRGVAIHHKDCKNIFHTRSDHKNRLVEVEWQDQSKENYFVDIEVLAYKRHGLIRDINMVLSNNKIDITNFNTFFNKSRNESKIVLTVVLSDIELLSKILDHISQIPNVSEVKRIKSKG
jgi:GTP pyrophosphokinase